MKGQRRVERIDPKLINDDFVVDFPLSTAQRVAIETIYNMRTVKIRQLVDITGYSYQYLSKAMAELHVNRFVERQFPMKERDQKGSDQAYFMLDQAGAIFISGYYEIPMKELSWSRRDNLIKYDKLNHAFEISEVRASIEKVARANKHRIANCVCDRHLYLEFMNEEKKYVLRPDMYFAYSDNKKHYNYFVEVDLGTMAVTGNSPRTEAFTNKIPYYEGFKISGAYKNTYNVFPRVLVITTTTDRAEKLFDAVKEKQQAGVEFLFTSLALWHENPTGPIFIKANEGNVPGFKVLKMFD